MLLLPRGIDNPVLFEDVHVIDQPDREGGVLFDDETGSTGPRADRFYEGQLPYRCENPVFAHDLLHLLQQRVG
jgi:hypothetical protein